MGEDPEPSSEGASVRFDFDRMTVQRFRDAFPRARWDDIRKAWVVPGKTAARRIARWQALEATKADVHADAKGRDAFLFGPIESAYLEPGLDLLVRTPYSRTVVDQLRQVPFARWDESERAWRVPYRSYEDLKRRWPDIEAAARRNEPEERRRRNAEAKGSETLEASRRRSAERRRRRYPVPVDDAPPLNRPVSTTTFGLLVFTASNGELADDDTVRLLYPDISRDTDLVWIGWRSPSLEELVKTWPSRIEPTPAERARGWWLPTKPELVVARKAVQSGERRKQRRGSIKGPAVSP